ncbi:hypothetical protein WJT74_09640 [Sphingomicrobium sp. XHP0239]|uniref:hypothetical protein n=1 Tax=Sphingomicrobium maritimum TaxID=3133972 RepID=UPI0031CCD205
MSLPFLLSASLALALPAPPPASPGGAAGANDFTAPRDAPGVMEATVSPRPDGRYAVALDFREEAPVWIFLRSNGPVTGEPSWRAGTWEVRTPGVTLTRIGLHEALVANDGGPVPGRVEIAVAPYTRNLNADYQPAIRIGENALALFSDHFLLRPAASVAAVEALGADWTVLPDYDAGHPLARFEGEGFVVDGMPVEEVAVTEAAYVLHGDIASAGSGALVTYLDPRLPAWLGTELERDIPAIIRLYEAQWGPHDDGTLELMVEWGGPTAGSVSLGGSVIGSQMVMRLEGQALLDQRGGAGAEMRMLIAHEAAHFWLGNLVAYGRPGEAWTSEGGADLAALRAIEAVDPAGAARREGRMTRSAWRQCATYLERGGLASAPERGEQKAFYSCGFLLSRVAERVAERRGGTFFTFWAKLIERHREAGEVGSEDWFEALAQEGAAPATLAAMRTIVERGGGGAAITDLYASAQMPPPDPVAAVA